MRAPALPVLALLLATPAALHAQMGPVPRTLGYAGITAQVAHCLSQTIGCRVTLDLNTDNNIFYGGIGPQLMLPLGPVEPYVNAEVQLSYFGTMSSLSGSGNADSFANTTNYDDLTAAWSAGGGMSIALPFRRTRVAIDLGARLHHNGVVRYLREGDIQDNADGSITLHPQHSEANLMVYHIGVRIGVH
ncbi:MAG: hypothetical protein P8099_18480 [Gemmatimonadota bacterium]